MTDVAALGASVTLTGAAEADKQLLRFAASAAKAENAAAALNKPITGLRDASGKFVSANKLAAETLTQSGKSATVYGNSIEQLRSKYVPLFAATKQYEAELRDIAAAERLGAISADEAASARTRAASGLQRTSQFTKAAGVEMKNYGGHTANVFAQLNDIAVMMAAGQNPMQLAMQQGTQLNQVWGQLGGKAGAIGSVIKGAFMSMLSPINLVTLAVIAGGAALVGFFTGGSEGAKTFKDSVTEAETAINNIHEASVALSLGGLEDLRKKYGAITDEVRALVEQERLLAISDGAKKINEALGGLTEKLGEGLLSTAYGDIENIFNVTSNSAQILYGVLEDIKNQGSLDKQLASIIAMKDRLSEATDGFTNMNDKQAEMLKSLTTAESLVRQQQRALAETPAVIDASVRATNNWAGAMSGVLSYVSAISRTLSSISGSGISLAAIQTETELLKQGKTLREAGYAAAQKTSELEGKKRTAELKIQYGIAGEFLGKIQANREAAVVAAQGELDIQRDLARERESNAKKGGAAGAAALKSAEKGFQTLRELLEKESLFQFAEQEKRQAQLDEALSKQLVSKENYEKMSAQLRTMFFGAEWEVKALQYDMDQEALQNALDRKLITEEEYLRKRKELNWANLLSEDNRSDMAVDLDNTSKYFSELNSLAGGGFDAILKAQKAFGAATALVNTYIAASQALADPKLSFWMKFAAVAKVVAAGMGLVNAIKGGGKSSSGGGSSATPSASTATQAAPERVVRVDFQGDPFLTAMASSMMDQIYAASKGGRVIIAQ